MSAIATVIKNQLQNCLSFINLTVSYFKKRNPVVNSISSTVNSIYVFLSSGKRLKVLKYQVQLMYYRMHQMDKLIKENNPHNSSGGNILNKYR